MCATLRRWADRGDRELPWLTGQVFSALAGTGVAAPTGPGVKVLERFLLGAESDAARVAHAINQCIADAGPPSPALPPDARGGLVRAVERFYEALAEAYGALHVATRDGHRRYVDDALAQHQGRLDDAAADIEERVRVLQGAAATVKKRARPRRARDRNGVAIAFVLLALTGACVLVYLVLQGWPMVPYDFPF